MRQPASDGDEQYDSIAERIALQLIVDIDETGGKVGTRSSDTWIFSTTLHVRDRCGESRAKSEAAAVLGEACAGIGVTDDDAAYNSLVARHPLCWAHLIRQAIQLARHDKHPAHPEYETILDPWCDSYHQALRHPRDDRRSVGRAAQAAQLLDQLRPLCTRQGERIMANETPAFLVDFLRGQNELLENPDCLFVFVETPAVEATNNRSERNAHRAKPKSAKAPAPARRPTVPSAAA